MYRKWWWLIIVLLLMAGFAFGYHTTQSWRQQPDDQVSTPTTTATTTEETPTVAHDDEPNTASDNAPEVITATPGLLSLQCPPTMDNTKYGWGLRVLSGHRTPEIGSKAQSLVNTYHAIFTGDTSKKVVYLTFDEGYEAGHSGKILDILKDNGVKAAFFITGTFLKSNPELVARMVEDGHIIGDHTVNHPSLPTLNDDEFFKEVLGLAQDYQQQTGKAMNYLRPPKGEYSERTLCMARVLGYRTVFWSIAMADWVPLKGGPEEAYTTVMSRLHPGAVILLHAVSPDNVQILDRLIKDIRAEGYEFATLDEIE